MKTKAIQQEVLLSAIAAVTKHSLRAISNTYSHPLSPSLEQLEKACWDGLLDEVVPYLITKPTSGRKLFIWHIRQGYSCLQIQLSEYPLFIEQSFSIDPRVFLPVYSYS